jgi:membrane protease YdiL (CAAX protease family)
MLLMFLWLGTMAYRLGELGQRELPSWAAWRLADQQLRLAGFETGGQVLPLVAEEGDWDRKELMAHWAALLERDTTCRSRAASAVLWHLAGKEERAEQIAWTDRDDPDRTELVRVLLNGERADQGSLDRSRAFLAGPSESYWWEEQLWLEVAARSKDEAQPLVAEAAAARSRRALDLMAWRSGVEIFIAVAGVVCLGIFLWRSRGKLRWHPVPPVFRRIGWRPLLAGVAAAEVAAFVAILALDWLLGNFRAWDHGSLALYQTFWRCLAPLFLMLLFFRKPVTAVRAMRLNRGFKLTPVLAGLGLAVLSFYLCWWLLPHGSESSSGFALDPWTFGPQGLFYALWLGSVVAPLCEEIVFRGFLFNALQVRFGMLPALLVANGIFSAVHGYGWDGAVSVFLDGVFFSLLYRLSGSLAAAVACHGLLNFYIFASTWYTFESLYW